MTLHRTVGIIGFGLLLVLVMVVLAVLGLAVAINAFRGRRKMEPSFLSWIAAMLFATIPIRNFLPGNPPPGSWVDIAVVLWVIVALGAALAFGVVAWSRGTAPPTSRRRVRSGPPSSPPAPPPEQGNTTA